MSDEIVRITERKHIASILAIEDERLTPQVLYLRDITKAEWVQWLENIITREDHIRMWGVLKDNKLVYYLVAINAMMPPISREVLLLYSNFYGSKSDAGEEYNLMALEKVKEWAKELGALRIQTFTQYPRVMSKFGFQKEDAVSVVLQVN